MILSIALLTLWIGIPTQNVDGSELLKEDIFGFEVWKQAVHDPEDEWTWTGYVILDNLDMEEPMYMKGTTIEAVPFELGRDGAGYRYKAKTYLRIKDPETWRAITSELSEAEGVWSGWCDE